MCRNQNYSQIFGHKGHCIFFAAGEMRQEFRMTWKTVAAEKKRALVYRRSGNRVDATGSTQLNGCFYVAGCGSARRAGFNARLDKTVNIVEMIDYRLGQSLRNRFTLANDVIA